MSTQPPDSLNNVKTLQDHLLCPILQEPLSEAVSLVPCAHKIQQAAAEQIFGTTKGGCMVSSNTLCPVCKIPVIGYILDPQMRYVVKQLFELPEKDIITMLSTVKKN